MRGLPLRLVRKLKKIRKHRLDFQTFHWLITAMGRRRKELGFPSIGANRATDGMKQGQSLRIIRSKSTATASSRVNQHLRIVTSE
jgi:hypothetical protein